MAKSQRAISHAPDLCAVNGPSTPYASVIIQSHDRFETLPLSIASVLAQTVRDIELIIVGDGCTDNVRDVACAVATADSRVRFLNRPKAPFGGAANRDFAVQAAKSDRIFYCDDDDLLLPNHVEALGRELDDVDVVDTPAVSVHPEGGIAVGIHNSADSLQKQLLLEEQLKAVFDTHLAHRKSAYANETWLRATGNSPAYGLLKYFAACSDILWKTLPVRTALSFHGACRTGMPGGDREQELRLWMARLNAGTLPWSSADHAFHALRLMLALRNVGKLDAVKSEIALSPSDMDDLQAGILDGVWWLVTGCGSTPVRPARILDSLLDARLGPALPTAGVLNLFLRRFSSSAIDKMLDKCTVRPAVSLARFTLHCKSRSIDESSLEAVESAPRWLRFYLLVAAASSVAPFNLLRTFEILQDIADLAPESRHAVPFWQLFHETASALGREDVARVAAETCQGLRDRFS